MLVVENVRFSYGDKEVLKGISFELQKGEIVGLVGANGSGKTTLIQNILNILIPSSGSISINGLSNNDVNSLKNIVYISGNDYLPNFLTGMEYIELLFDMYKSKLDREKLDRMLEYYALNDFIHKNIENYSHGMKKKLQIISALVINPEIIIVDETLNGLDIVSREITKSLFNQFITNEKSILLCTHDFSLVEELKSRAIFINDGIIKYDSLEYLKKGESLSKIFYDIILKDDKSYVL